MFEILTLRICVHFELYAKIRTNFLVSWQNFLELQPSSEV